VILQIKDLRGLQESSVSQIPSEVVIVREIQEKSIGCNSLTVNSFKTGEGNRGRKTRNQIVNPY